MEIYGSVSFHSSVSTYGSVTFQSPVKLVMEIYGSVSEAGELGLKTLCIGSRMHSITFSFLVIYQNITLQEALALHGFTLRDCHWEDVKMCKTSLNRNELHYCKVKCLIFFALLPDSNRSQDLISSIVTKMFKPFHWHRKL